MINEYDIKVNENGTLDLIIIREIDYDLGDLITDDDIMNMMRMEYKLDELDSENAYLVCFDNNRNVNGIYHISRGDYKSCCIYNRTIAAMLLLSRSLKFMVIHNHPRDISGQMLQPSAIDLANAAILESLARLFDIEFLGGYIITSIGYVKVAEHRNPVFWG